MKNILKLFFLTSILFAYGILNGQGVGIGTVTPDTSAALHINSDDKGLLMPRMTSAQRDLITLPAKGLMIYNLTTDDSEMNTGTSSIPNWTGTKDGIGSNPADIVTSVTETGDLSTTSLINELIPGMALSPPAGTYLIFFNAQYGLQASVPVNTEQGVIDLAAAYDAVMAIPATNTTHGPIFGNGEVLLPGVYSLPAAVSLAATLTMDGGGDTNSVFIIRMVGALTTGALTTVVLTNGARARNIFWVCEAAIALAASTIMKGTLIAHAGAVSMAAGSNLEGRMFSLTGAMTLGPGTLWLPSGTSYIDLGILSTFVLFTSAGAIANTPPSDITGDVGTNAGAIAGFEGIDGNIYGPGAAPNPVNNTLVTYTLYQNGVPVPNSARTVDINTSVIATQAMGTVTEGQTIEVWWKVDKGGVFIGNRILSLVRVAL